jgi:hypothetical protein
LVNVKLFFDDLASTRARLAMYRAASVRNVAFWRLGQEDPGLWEGIAIEAPAAPPPIRDGVAPSSRPLPLQPPRG